MPPQILRDPEAWAESCMDIMQSAYEQASLSDASSRESLYRSTAEGTILSRQAHAKERVFETVARRHELLTGTVLSRRFIDLGVAVVARRANTPEMRAKAGKMGRAIKILRGTQLITVDEIAAYLEEQGGIEGLLAEARRQPALSSTELVVTCTPDQTEEVRALEGEIVTLRVEIQPSDSRGMKPIVLLEIISDAAADNGSPDDEQEGGDPFADPDDEDPFG